MPKITIDDKILDFKPGQTIIEVADENGIEIPHFCWHKRLSVSGNCRMCLVEIEKMPKLMIACSTQAADGMVVKVNSEKAIKGREHVMEFILINHPLDCPICDEAGECKLQDYAYKYSVGTSRFNEEKVHKDKRVKLGPYVMFDAERCISCSRCIRFSNEIAKQEQLTFVQRGDRVTIVTFPGKSFDNPYSLNVVDICPVGALTNADFRFKARVWDMSSTKSICPGCSRGCNIDIWVRNNEILRLTPRFNESVNDFWMCDYGRINCFKFVNAETRIDSPEKKANGFRSKITWEEAISLFINEIKDVKPSEIAVIASPYDTLEDIWLTLKFTKSILKTPNLFSFENNDFSKQDDILIRADRTPNRKSLEILGIKILNNNDFKVISEQIKNGTIKKMIVIDEDLLSLSAEDLKIFDKLESLILFASNRQRLYEYSKLVFPSSTYAEKNGLFINFQNIIQRIRPAVTTKELDRTLDHLSMSRLDKFGTEFDRWGKAKKIDAKSTWKILSQIANAFDKKYKYQTSEDIFLEIAETIPLFKDLNYEKIGEQGLKLKN